MTTFRTPLATSPLEYVEVEPAGPRAAVGRRWPAEAGVCAAVFALLVAWVLLYPYTADGDSILHYLNARDTAKVPADCLHSWARPGYKLFLVPFAVHGVLAARVFMAAVGTAVVWQTMRLAADLGLRRSYLAGPMVLWQCAAFAVAADTMTEFPMALGLVIAVRLWQAGRLGWSCLVVGFLPSVRPEGFFFGVVWGLMVAHQVVVEKRWRRAGLFAVLSVGLAAWAVALWVVIDSWQYLRQWWNWPPGGYDSYGRGPIWHYVVQWPVYAGVPATLLFVAGIRASWRQRNLRLSWAVWGTVIGVHSVLFWGGWFASCGLLRILSCTAPFTAVICLCGWNRLADRMADGGWTSVGLRRAGWAAAAVASGWTLVQYAVRPEHSDCFPLMRCTAYVRDHQMVGPDTWFFAGNQIARADLDLPALREHVMDTPCDPAKIKANLDALPIGAVGVWDDRQAPVWHGQTIESLAAHGFTIVYDTHTQCGWWDLHYAVLRKDRQVPFGT